MSPGPISNRVHRRRKMDPHVYTSLDRIFSLQSSLLRISELHGSSWRSALTMVGAIVKTRGVSGGQLKHHLATHSPLGFIGEGWEANMHPCAAERNTALFSGRL